MPRKISSSFLLLSAMAAASSLSSLILSSAMADLVRSPLALVSCILSLSFLVLVNKCNSDEVDGRGSKPVLSNAMMRLVDNDDGAANDSTLPTTRRRAVKITTRTLNICRTKAQP